MSLTRKMLKAMGIEDEKIDQIIEAHTETVDALKEQRDGYKADADKLPDVQKKLGETEKQLEANGKDSYKVKYDALKEDFEKHTAQEAEYARQLEETRAAFTQKEEEHKRQTEQRQAEYLERETDYKQQLEAGKAYIEHIKEEAARQAHVADLEQQRTSMMLELVNKEKDMMQQSYARDYAELTRLREQYNQLSTENAQHCEELRLIHASRGFKLLNMGYPIKKRIWKIFGKEI